MASSDHLILKYTTFKSGIFSNLSCATRKLVQSSSVITLGTLLESKSRKRLKTLLTKWFIRLGVSLRNYPQYGLKTYMRISLRVK